MKNNIVYAGNVGVDFYIDLKKIFPGGSALNFVINYKSPSNDDNVSVVSVLGNDQNSDFTKKCLIKNQIFINHLYIFSGKTAVQYIKNNINGEKIFTYYDNGVLDKFQLTNKDKKFISSQDAVVTTVYKQIINLFDQVIKIKTKGIKIVDFRDLSDFNKDFSFIQKYQHDFDICYLSLNIKEKSLINKIKKFSKQKNKLIIVTLGKNGSIAFFGNEVFIQKSLPGKVIDTTGCGDAYLAGFVSEYLKSKDIAKSMFVGTKLASKIASHYGAVNYI